MGYIGGILALLIVYFGFVRELFGLEEDGLAYRRSVGAAVWTIVFALPFVFNVPEAHRREAQKVGFFPSYAVLVHDIAALLARARHTVWFLIASAVFRDGLAGVFAFGGVLAASSSASRRRGHHLRDRR